MDAIGHTDCFKLKKFIEQRHNRPCNTVAMSNWKRKPRIGQKKMCKSRAFGKEVGSSRYYIVFFTQSVLQPNQVLNNCYDTSLLVHHFSQVLVHLCALAGRGASSFKKCTLMTTALRARSFAGIISHTDPLVVGDLQSWYFDLCTISNHPSCPYRQFIKQIVLHCVVK